MELNRFAMRTNEEETLAPSNYNIKSIKIISNVFFGNDNVNILKELLKKALLKELNKQITNDDVKYLIKNMRHIFSNFNDNFVQKRVPAMSLKQYILTLNNKSLGFTFFNQNLSLSYRIHQIHSFILK